MVRKRVCISCGCEKFLFSFPGEESARKLWLESIGLPSNKMITTKDKICGRHFAPDQFKNNNLRRLRDGACPSDSTCEHYGSERETEEPNVICKRLCAICGYISANGFYRFPSDIEIRQQWANFCDLGINEIKSHLRLCDRHFKYEDYRMSTQRKLLMPTSIPTLLPKIKRNSSSSFNHNSESRISVTNISIPSLNENALVNVICSPDIQNDTDYTVDAAPRKPYFRFFGDIKDDDIVNTEAAKLALKMGKQEIEKFRQKVKSLQNENFKLKKRCSGLVDTVAELKKRIKEMDDEYFG